MQHRSGSAGLTPRVLVEAHLKIGGDVIAALPSAKIPIVAGSRTSLADILE
jgi:hypothetical protein